MADAEPTGSQDQGPEPTAVDDDETHAPIVARTPSDEIRAVIAERHITKRTEDLDKHARDQAREREDEGRDRGDPAPAAPKPETVTVKVFGQAYTVPKADVEAMGGVEAYQMTMAADLRLKEAKEVNAKAIALREENERIRAELEDQRHAAQPAARPGASSAPTEDGLTAEQRAEIEQYRENDYPEEFIAQTTRIFRIENRLADPSDGGNADSLADRVADQALNKLALQEQERAKETANRLFHESYAHVESDPHLRAVAQTEIANIRAVEPELPLTEVVMRAGKFAEGFGRRSTGSETRSRDKLQRKQSAARATASGANARMASTPEPQAPSTSDIIKRMRQARQQPV